MSPRPSWHVLPSLVAAVASWLAAARYYDRPACTAAADRPAPVGVARPISARAQHERVDLAWRARNHSYDHSYDPERMSSSARRELRRLRAQADVAFPAELEILERTCHLRDGMRIADIGCGGGDVARILLLAFPRAHVTCIDADPRMITYARRNLQRVGAAGRWSTAHADATRACPPFGHRSAGGHALGAHARFDFALVRYVLQHVPQPHRLVDALRLMLRPGGTVALIDVDDGLGAIIQPPIATFARHAAKLSALQLARGGNRLVGRELPKLLRRAGFGGVHVRAALASSDSVEHGLGRFRPFLDADRLQPLAELGALSHLTVERARREAARWFARGEAGSTVMIPSIVTCGRRLTTAASDVETDRVI